MWGTLWHTQSSRGAPWKDIRHPIAKTGPYGAPHGKYRALWGAPLQIQGHMGCPMENEGPYEVPYGRDGALWGAPQQRWGPMGLPTVQYRALWAPHGKYGALWGGVPHGINKAL